MIQSLSDKALIYEAQGGNEEAVIMLGKRFGFHVPDIKAVMAALKRLKVTSVNAARRIVASNAS